MTRERRRGQLHRELSGERCDPSYEFYAPQRDKAHPEFGPETLSHYITLPPEVLKNIPIPPAIAAVDASQIRYWVDIMRQQNMLTKPIDPATVMVP